ncbi:MAG TPA: glycosyltransferase [Ktedonobacteraceae bacterium]|jgi:phosphatidylinositol alpha 1,6-mannosyltransferase|nr:glycosyltransferase [Ktedonobacteraceae bacterium]
MRIMIVTDQYPPMVGGVPTVTQGLAVDFANRGNQVWVVAPSSGQRDVHRLEQKVHVYRFSSFEWPTYEDLRIPFLPILPFRRLLKKIDPDIIHIHSPIVLGNIAQIVAGSLRKPVIVTNHYLPINLSRSLSSDPLFGKPFMNVTYSYLVHFCNRCEYVTAPTMTALNLLYEHGLRAPAQAISNGVDLKKFSPGDRDIRLQQHFHLPQDRPLILSVNRLSQEKRIDVLIDAVAKMTQDAHIAIASTGPAEAELRAKVEQLNLMDKVSFLGFVPDKDLASLYRLADIFAIPSEAELQSLATMEAMACGLPVVSADAYALPELVHHELNGFLFQRGDSEEMAQYLDVLVIDEELRRHMGSKSLEIIAKHDRIQVLDQWEALYLRLSNEFVEAKERRLRRHRERKIASYVRNRKTRPRMVRTSDLAIDQRFASEE